MPCWFCTHETFARYKAFSIRFLPAKQISYQKRPRESLQFQDGTGHVKSTGEWQCSLPPKGVEVFRLQVVTVIRY